MIELIRGGVTEQKVGRNRGHIRISGIESCFGLGKKLKALFQRVKFLLPSIVSVSKLPSISKHNYFYPIFS